MNTTVKWYETAILWTEELRHKQLEHVPQGNNNIYTQAYLLAQTFSSSSHCHITCKDLSTWATPHLLKHHVPPTVAYRWGGFNPPPEILKF